MEALHGFSGALNADAATDATCYCVQINDVSVEIESLSYNTSTATVTVGLAEGALRSGDRITVQWHDLQDKSGRDISGQTQAIIAG